MRRLLIVAAISAAAAFAAYAQTADKEKDPASSGASSGESGAEGPAMQNLLTSDQARQHLMRLGYTNVSALEKDADGKWIGTATKDGKTIAVAVDLKGEVDRDD